MATSIYMKDPCYLFSYDELVVFFNVTSHKCASTITKFILYASLDSFRDEKSMFFSRVELFWDIFILAII